MIYHWTVCPPGHPIDRLKIGGLSAHFCPAEQRLS